VCLFSKAVNHTQKKSMDIYVIHLNTKLAAVYYNGGKSPYLFRNRTDITLYGLNDHLDQTNRQLNHRDTRRVNDIEYRCPSTDSTETLRYSWMKLMNNDDVRTMFSIFGRYNTKGPIELVASLVISVEEIWKSLIRPKNYEEIRDLLEEQDEKISLVHLWSIMFYFITCFIMLNYVSDVFEVVIFNVCLWN